MTDKPTSDVSDDLPYVSREVAEQFASELRQAAQLARTEEDLRIAAEERLRHALTRLGIDSQPSYERVYANHQGRSDAVYGQVVIEYEPVGALNTPGGIEHAREQLERYLRAEADDSKDFDALKRVVGVATDGYRIFFLRFRGSDIGDDSDLFVAPGQGILPLGGDLGHITPVMDGPYQVSAESIQTFLLYLRATTRSRLTPEGLAREFGPDGPCAKQVVREFARLFELNKNHPKISTLFAEWDRVFGIVYGVDLATSERHLPALSEAYDLDPSLDLKTALFCVHTYYALLMKMLAAELLAMQRESLIESYLHGLGSAPDERVRKAIQKIESGELFELYSVQNFLEADFFGWYLSAWNGEIAESIRRMIRLLGTFEPASGVLDPRPTQDLLKRLYQYLIPRQIRHDLGEFYTPNWLAELAINRSGFDGSSGERVLDPACGSGTFLVAAINRMRANANAKDIALGDLARAILQNVVGFELNPLAVIAARTNYLLALGPLIRELPLVELPVYLCDSILAPASTDFGLLGEEYELRTSAGTFRIPLAVIDAQQLPKLTGLLDRCLQDAYTTSEFSALARHEIGEWDIATSAAASTLYDQLIILRDAGRDGVWARIIRNAFAPLTCGVFDYVIGNPPWVNWQSLAKDYREATIPLWRSLGLFSLTGHAARLGGGKKDLSALMLYRSMDSYLRNGGRLSFVITQSLFKSKGAGDGFRRFRLGSGSWIRVLSVDDLTVMQPFEGATTQTAVVVVEKGAATTYPVNYTKWRRKLRVAKMVSASLSEVESAYARDQYAAWPVQAEKSTSPWMTAEDAISGPLRATVGKSAYKAFAGVCTWSNGIYWLNLNEPAPNGLIRVSNRAGEAKDGEVEVHDALMEPTYIFPFVRSRDIQRWGARPSSYMLVPQDPEQRRGVQESELRVNAPRTYRFLKSFELELSERSGMRKYFDVAKGDPFYSVYNVSGGTFAPFKVMWRQMVPRVTAAVVHSVDDSFLGAKPVVTQHVVSVVAVETSEEAHYLCAMLNSSIVTCISASYATGKSYGTPSMLDHVAIPRYQSSNELHTSATLLSVEAHHRVANGLRVDKLDHEVDLHAAQILGLPESSISVMQDFVRSLARRPPLGTMDVS